MFKRGCVAIALVLLVAHPALAGAWMRDKGHGFVSSTVNANRDGGTTSTYLEYGLTDRVTLGADMFMTYDVQGTRDGYGTLFLRHALGPTDRANKWALVGGGGVAVIGFEVLPFLKTGLSWGRGYQLGTRQGWIAVDSAVLWDLTYAQHVHKLDTAIGLALTPRLRGLFEVYLDRTNGTTTTTLAPSLLIQTGAKRQYTLQIGAEIPRDDRSAATLTIGFWNTF